MLALLAGVHGDTIAVQAVGSSGVARGRPTRITRAQGGVGVLRAIRAVERRGRIGGIAVRFGAHASFSTARAATVIANALAYARGIPVTSDHAPRRAGSIQPRYTAAPSVTLPE